jgi:predicted ester cyclase
VESAEGQRNRRDLRFDRSPQRPGDFPDALKKALARRRTAFSDIHVTVDDQVAEGEKVSTRRTWRATHRGPYRGVAPTGKQMTWTQISVVRFSQGRIVEDWAVADELSILQQLGALPT